jgi:hypothetical protein
MTIKIQHNIEFEHELRSTLMNDYLRLKDCLFKADFHLGDEIYSPDTIMYFNLDAIDMLCKIGNTLGVSFELNFLNQ